LVLLKTASTTLESQRAAIKSRNLYLLVPIKTPVMH